MSYVQYGCGYSAPEGWLNFDWSPTIRLARLPAIGRFVQRLKGNELQFPSGIEIGDIVRGLPIGDQTASGVYASHVLEHLSRSDVETALRNTYRMLRPGGIFRLIVPDLESRARLYLSKLDSGTNDANDWFMTAAHLGLFKGPSTITEKVSRTFGGSLHLWMWDFPSMQEQLRRAGFVKIRRCNYGDSEDAMFSRVEDPTRFVDPKHQTEELALEARRPQE
ncbi:SAM-dependent methyltransferase [Bradyrhizobium sp. JR1.5]|uniref:class I SAM-dependent methyltransferase n=1 Tax=unclassified Bradyrhizobium TaxID=2631580 RepID=UPI00339B99B3